MNVGPFSKPVRWPVWSGSLLTLLSGQGLSAGLSLLYGKLTALYISPDVWGEYSLLLVAVTFVHSLLVSPTIQSFKSALGQFSHPSAIRFYGQVAGLIYLLVMPLVALLAGLYYQNPVFGLIWLVAVGQGLYQAGADYRNALGQHRQFTRLQVGYAAGALVSFGVVVVGLQHYTSIALWQSAALVNGLFAVLSITPLTRQVRPVQNPFPDRIQLFRAYQRYVTPLLSMAVWAWVLNYADRYLIRLYLTDADVGQYSMGYSLGAKLLLFASPLLAFLSPQVLSLRTQNQPPSTANPLLLRYVRPYLGLAGIACLLFFLSRNWVGTLLLSDRYSPAFDVAPLVAVGYLFLTSIHLLELKWYTFGQTRYILLHTVFGVVVNLAFNVLLIPRLGIAGAAWATAIGYAAQFALARFLFQR
ncbi:lipopolysaccharide biosynthesis protein [Spirosoma rhododendri]|uniref:Polysaccharide biosynthesis protein C-terminal domain-containing protein n=1 Tax=Spirosoma rhododendri TaxID=2728024 RepID=A0A7L5DJW3_9BACT|nr:polysaccharide biosynthesis C-terminal domain-containing protein [Spirosoma rhododendri]QJD77443.1 hypothetical protein HH216_02700 [Spirosoma rhododendri]